MVQIYFEISIVIVMYFISRFISAEPSRNEHTYHNVKIRKLPASIFQPLYVHRIFRSCTWKTKPGFNFENNNAFKTALTI